MNMCNAQDTKCLSCLFVAICTLKGRKGNFVTSLTYLPEMYWTVPLV
jgi:hypothetical protein